jgi:hypothetical protein
MVGADQVDHLKLDLLGAEVVQLAEHDFQRDPADRLA